MPPRAKVFQIMRNLMPYTDRITIKETTSNYLENIKSLWNNGEVMFFVGYPTGLGVTLEDLKNWLPWAISKPGRCHYSIYARKIGYCGETFYNVDSSHKTAAMDIKLLPNAQGKGIARKALTFAINKAFEIGNAERVYVDPHLDNEKGWSRYKKLGFVKKPRPKYLGEGPSYLEITKDQWFKK